MKKSLLLIIISLALGFIFLLPFTLFGILNIGNAAGLILSLVLCIYGAFFEKTNKAVASLWKKKLWKGVFSFLALITILAIIFTAAVTTQMIIAANNSPEKETTVIVLGCKVNPEGPSLSLIKRLEAAYDYLTKNPKLNCILSGGQGNDEPMSEARAMKNWLTERGIDESRLYLEDNSTSTWENLSFSKKLIKKEGLCPAVTIITNDFHQYRAQKIAKSLNMESYSVSGETPLYLLPTYYIRELGATLAQRAGLILQ